MSVREILERARYQLADATTEQEVLVAACNAESLLRQALAALDAEGAGLPWVSVEERLPDESQGDLLVYNTKWVDSVAAEDVDENCRGWYWLPLSAIPLPGQSGAKEGAGLREAREMMHRVRLGIGRLLRDRMPADPSDMRAWAEDLDRGIDAALRADEEGKG